MKTTIGRKYVNKKTISKCPYITGYFRVLRVDKINEVIYMDPTDSLLLLGNPIKLDCELASKIFSNKPSGYWDEPSFFVQRVGSTLRNRMARPSEVRLVINELTRRYNDGAQNYLGENYVKL